MSQSMPASNASRFGPLTVIDVVLEVDQVDVLRLVGQEDLAAAGDLHQRGALAAHRLLEHPAQAARAGVLERHVALVGDHRAELGLDRDLRPGATFSSLEFCSAKASCRLGLVELRERRLHRADPFVEGSEAPEPCRPGAASQAIRTGCRGAAPTARGAEGAAGGRGCAAARAAAGGAAGGAAGARGGRRGLLGGRAAGAEPPAERRSARVDLRGVRGRA